MCYCRHKMQHLGRACDAPMDICMTFGGFGRFPDPPRLSPGGSTQPKAWTCCRRRQGAGLVQFGENVRAGSSFICNCCGCCCEAMIAARRFAA